MLAYTRERLSTQLLGITPLVDLYQQRDPRFPGQVISWLAAMEKSLAPLRLPLVSMVASERARLIAAQEGFRDPAILNDRPVSARKKVSATAFLSLSHVQTAIAKIIADIDSRFDLWREKMAQLLAVATMKAPIPLPPTEPRDVWVAKVWSGLNIDGEVQGMYRYLAAAMQPSDRLHLLDEVLTNLIT